MLPTYRPKFFRACYRKQTIIFIRPYEYDLIAVITRNIDDVNLIVKLKEFWRQLRSKMYRPTCNSTRKKNTGTRHRNIAIELKSCLQLAEVSCVHTTKILLNSFIIYVAKDKYQVSLLKYQVSLLSWVSSGNFMFELKTGWLDPPSSQSIRIIVQRTCTLFLVYLVLTWANDDLLTVVPSWPGHFYEHIVFFIKKHSVLLLVIKY